MQFSKKKRQPPAFAPLADDTGSALLIAMMILLVLTILGIAATNTSQIEILISGNDKIHKMAFHNSDSGVYTVAKVISKAINDKATPYLNTASPFTYGDAGSSDTASGRTFFRELSGFEDYDTAADISFQNDGTHTIDVDVERLKSVSLVGGGAEFASGMEGHGASLKGIYFGIDSLGRGPSNAQSTVGSRYLKVLGTAGGL
ncbi:MAG: hypothetical protein JEZ12_03580 [Desulfobacterium sp.]|nr:hypothetical protein [Desulfobacterium sp.]